ncbi:hypothetical protein Tco_0683753 [Tanacetum coccineum]
MVFFGIWDSRVGVFSSAGSIANELHRNSAKITSSNGVLRWNGGFASLSRRASKSSSSFIQMISILKYVSSFRIRVVFHRSVSRKGRLKIVEGTLLSYSISRITKSARKMNLPTSTSIFLAILTGYWNDLSGNLTLILVGLRVSRDSLAYTEYGIRLMLAPRSTRALQENVLLKLHGIRKLPRSSSLGGTLFWIIAELLSLRKW